MAGVRYPILGDLRGDILSRMAPAVLVAWFTTRTTPARHDRAARRHPLDERRGDAVDISHPVQVEFDADRIAEKSRRARMFQPPEVARRQSATHVDMQAFAVPGDPDSCHDIVGASNRVPASRRAFCLSVRPSVVRAGRENRIGPWKPRYVDSSLPGTGRRTPRRFI